MLFWIILEHDLVWFSARPPPHPPPNLCKPNALVLMDLIYLNKYFITVYTEIEVSVAQVKKVPMNGFGE